MHAVIFLHHEVKVFGATAVNRNHIHKQMRLNSENAWKIITLWSRTVITPVNV